MPRPIKIRPSYVPDAAFLLRRMEAVALDVERHTPEWLREAQEKLKDAAQHFLTAREDELKKAELDRDEARQAEPGRNRRAK